MRDEDMIENAATIGEQVLGPGLRALAEKHHIIGEVRGLGVFWALDLVKDRETREPLAPYGGSSPAMAQLQAECRARGYLPFVNFNRVHVVPPCNVSADEVAEGLAILDDVFTALAPHYAGE
jgi:taurine--2-oxoglutarate transaminase